MLARTLVVLGFAAWALACGSDQNGAQGEALAVTGIYEVKGTTAEEGGANKRHISGVIRLVEAGEGYTADFKLHTDYPTPDGPVSAMVIGGGEGVVSGGTLEGEAETQIVLSTVPGVDTQFAMIPHSVGPRIFSESVAELNPDGTISVEIRSVPREGEQYTPTRTTLRGVRVATAALDQPLPDVAAPAARD